MRDPASAEDHPRDNAGDRHEADGGNADGLSPAVAISGYVLAVPDDAVSTYQAASTVLEPDGITRVRRRDVIVQESWLPR